MDNENIRKEALNKEAEPVTIITSILISIIAPIIIEKIFTAIVDMVKKGKTDQEIENTMSGQLVQETEPAVSSKAAEIDKAPGGQAEQSPEATQTGSTPVAAAASDSNEYMIKNAGWASLALKALKPLAQPIVKWLVQKARQGVTEVTKQMIMQALTDIVKNIVSNLLQSQPQQQAPAQKPAMDMLVNECIKKGAPVGSLRAAYDAMDFAKVAEITSEYDLDADIVKEALPIFDWFKSKPKNVSELRNEIRNDRELADEIKSRVRTFGDIFKRYVAEYGSEKAAREKFSGEYGDRVPDSIRTLILSQRTGDPAANLIIGLAISTAMLNARSILMTKYYPDVVQIVKRIPGDSTDNLRSVMMNVLRPFIGVNFPEWSAELRLEKPESAAAEQPEWYPEVKAGLKQLEEEISSGKLSSFVASRLSDAIFDSAPSGVGFDVEETLVGDYLTSRVEEALASFPGGVTPASPSEYTYRKDAIRDLKSLVSDMINARSMFAKDLAARLMTALHNYAENASPEIVKELSDLSRKWDRGLVQALDKAYMNAARKFFGKVKAYEEWVMHPQAEVAACDELPKAAEEDTPLVRVAKKKDIGKGLKKYWKKHFKGRPKGSFSKAVDKLKGKVDKPEGLAAWLEHESTGKWPAENGKKKKKKASYHLRVVRAIDGAPVQEEQQDDMKQYRSDMWQILAGFLFQMRMATNAFDSFYENNNINYAREIISILNNQKEAAQAGLKLLSNDKFRTLLAQLYETSDNSDWKDIVDRYFAVKEGYERKYEKMKGPMGQFQKEYSSEEFAMPDEINEFAKALAPVRQAGA